MKYLIIAITFAAYYAFGQGGATSLEQIKIAADAGDPAAQDKMAEKDGAHAEMWYRKAANQGFVHAQGKLGFLLLLRAQTLIGLKPAERVSLADEGIKWATLAASQGDKQGQASLAQVYLEGRFVKLDLIEAYKWGDLSANNHSPEFIVFSGASFRDAAILKMNADQIAEAKRRVADFKPHIPKKSEVPAPAWIKEIKLNGISGGPDKRFATISDETFEKGENGTIKVSGKQVNIQCLEITDSTATISIKGLDGTLTLNLN